MQIDFLFDAVCPWCYIGKRRLEQMLAERGGPIPVINWQPFLLNPELPSGGIDRNAYLAGKFGSESRIRRIYGPSPMSACLSRSALISTPSATPPTA